MMKTFPSVGVVVLKADEVLLIVKDNHPKRAYQLPGGQIEPGESSRQAARRELEETTGLVARPEQLIKIPKEWEAVIQKEYGTAIFPFICYACTGYTGQIKRMETATPQWVQLAEVGDLLLNPNTENAINEARRLKV